MQIIKRIDTEFAAAMKAAGVKPDVIARMKVSFAG
jgi:hypothetical protein